MAWCEANGVDYVLVLPTNAVLRADPEIVKVADACAVKRAEDQRPVLRNYAETRYGAKSWTCPRRVAARIEASTMGMDIRYVVTSFTEGSAEHIYDTLYCALLRPRSDLLRLSPRGRAAERPSPCLQPHKPTPSVPTLVRQGPRRRLPLRARMGYHHGHAARSPKNRGPFQRLPAIAVATADRLL